MPKFFARLLMVIFIALVVYYGWLYIRSGSINNQISVLQSEIKSDRQSALTVPGRDELLTRQQQLQEVATLMPDHLYFSGLFPALAASTLNTASYTDLQADNTGLLTLTASVPSLEDLDKYLQVFNLPQVNKNFSNVKIVSFQKTQEKNSTSITFQVTMQYNSSIIQYNSGASGSSGGSN